MREICKSGSEGGEPQPNAASLPLSEHPPKLPTSRGTSSRTVEIGLAEAAPARVYGALIRGSTPALRRRARDEGDFA
jgi:hypothetical protein